MTRAEIAALRALELKASGDCLPSDFNEARGCTHCEAGESLIAKVLGGKTITALLAQAEAALDLAEALKDLREWAEEGNAECDRTVARLTSDAEDIRDAYAERTVLNPVLNMVNAALAKHADLLTEAK